MGGERRSLHSPPPHLSFPPFRLPPVHRTPPFARKVSPSEKAAFLNIACGGMWVIGMREGKRKTRVFTFFCPGASLMALRRKRGVSTLIAPLRVSGEEEATFSPPTNCDVRMGMWGGMGIVAQKAGRKRYRKGKEKAERTDE